MARLHGLLHQINGAVTGTGIDTTGGVRGFIRHPPSLAGRVSGVVNNFDARENSFFSLEQ
jgi:hypothetical protein